MTTKTTTKKTTTKKPARKATPKKTPAKKATRPNTAATPAKAKPKATTKAKPAKNATRANDAAKTAKANKPKRLSGLDLAAKVLAEAKEPLQAKAIAERAIAAGWKTNGKTPHATLYAAMIREIARKGKDARFVKTDRGLFAATTTKSRKGA
ncbi:MAG TPA: hypothetical protein ENJ00_06465 [Phycisphaerales bacterium]|nr:hypothetical protein [Phycisphaerales bacterium]